MRSALNKTWRDSATLILAAPLSKTVRTPQYLLLERSSKSSFMPGAQVFPGGALSPADYSPRWAELFQKSGVHLPSSLVPGSRDSAPIYHNLFPVTDKEDRIHPEVVLRICAIRETFEEAGILLATSTKNGQSSGLSQNQDKIAEWQEKVQKDPEEFVNLFDELDSLPDIAPLYDWSDWLTPQTFPAKHRFETIFYLIVLEEPWAPHPDMKEVQSAQWSTAEELLKGHADRKWSLMPPQFYEISRLRNVKDVDQFPKLFKSRLDKGVERWMPFISKTPEGPLFLMPGDDLYPSNPDYSLSSQSPLHFESTYKELRDSTKNYHRREGNTFLINVQRYGQIYY